MILFFLCLVQNRVGFRPFGLPLPRQQIGTGTGKSACANTCTHTMYVGAGHISISFSQLNNFRAFLISAAIFLGFFEFYDFLALVQRSWSQR